VAVTSRWVYWRLLCTVRSTQ